MKLKLSPKNIPYCGMSVFGEANEKLTSFCARVQEYTTNIIRIKENRPILAQPFHCQKATSTDVPVIALKNVLKVHQTQSSQKQILTHEISWCANTNYKEWEDRSLAICFSWQGWKIGKCWENRFIERRLSALTSFHKILKEVHGI